MGENCLIWENVTEHGNTADPLFVNPDSGDFHLRWGSPYIDYYTNEVSAASAARYAGDIDLDGNPRVQGSSIDFGCYESPASTAGYPYWSWRWGLGAWNEKGADGIYNVFRYVFDKPAGAFADPPLLGISFDEQGRAVIKTPPLVNTEGFDFSILATDALDSPLSGGTDYPIDQSGETTIPTTDKPARFFRLRATEAE